jgi:carboxypeptidase PM20D1
VTDHVRRTIDDERIQISVLTGVEPSLVSSLDTPGFAILQQTIRQVFPDAIVAPSLALGATDARHYVKLTNNVYRFLPLWVQREDVARYHGTNECVSVENYEQFIRFYIQLLRNSA